MRSRIAKATPLPLQKVCLLGLILSANNTSIWMIFSFLPFMVEFYFPSLSKTELGYRAGILGSAFSGGSLIGNIIWGSVSDRYGRRPALLCGLLGTAISSTLFGFSPTFTMAVASRFMWGLLNGNIGVAKTYLAEICDDSNSAKGMALFGVIGGFGRSIGPIIGGFLSSPAISFPGTFGGTIFETFPFALPSLVIAVNCLFVFLVALFALPETLPTAITESSGAITNGSNKDGGGKYALLEGKDEDEMEDPSGKNGIEMSSWNVDSKDNNMNRGHSSEALSEEDDVSKDVDATPNKKKKLTFAGVVTVKTIGSQSLGFGPLKGIDKKDRPLHSDELEEDIENGESHILDDGARSPPFSPLHSSAASLDLESNRGDSSGSLDGMDNNGVQRTSSRDDDDDEETKLIDPHNVNRHVVGKIRYSNGSEDETVITQGRTFWNMLYNIVQQPEIMISTLLYGTNAFSIIVFNEIFPLWVVTSKSSGGFEFTSYQIGISTMVSGVLGIVLQVTLYPYMTDHFGVLFVHKAGVVAFAISCILVPCASLVNSLHSSIMTWIMIVASQLLLNVTSTWVLVSVFVLINNSCYSYQRATVNGLGQTFASVGRLIGPYLGANLFAWSENNGLKWPMNFYLTFYFMAFIGFANWVLASRLPHTIQRRRKEPGVPMPPRRRRRTSYPDEDDDASSTSSITSRNSSSNSHISLTTSPLLTPASVAAQQSNFNKGQGIVIQQ